MAFPNVPNVAGVPPLPRLPGFILAVIQPLFSDVLGGFGNVVTPQWGIFKDGDPIVIAESVQRVEYRQDWDLVEYPLEQGAFESYNKVNTPFSAKVRFATGGNESDRQLLLQSIENIAGDLNLYDVVTPERIYTSTNINHYDYSRTSANGLGLLQIDVWVSEVRLNATAQFSNTQSDSSTSTVNDGTVQTGTPTSLQEDQLPDTQ